MSDYVRGTDPLFELLAREERGRLGGGHPAAARLTAYQADELDPSEAEEIQDHLAVCRPCAQKVLALPGFYEVMEAKKLAPASGRVPNVAETAASWQVLRARLASELAGAGVTPTVMGPSQPPPTSATNATMGGRFRRLTTSPFTVYALAAGLAACLIGFPLWIVIHPFEDLPGTPVVIYPLGNGEVTRGGTTYKLLSIRLADADAILALPVPRGQSFPAYRIDIYTPAGELLLTAPSTPTPLASPLGARGAGPEGARAPRIMTVGLTSRQLPPGEYRLRILGVRGAHAEALVEHALRIAQ